jgi:hypothetical protein
MCTAASNNIYVLSSAGFFEIICSCAVFLSYIDVFAIALNSESLI